MNLQIKNASVLLTILIFNGIFGGLCNLENDISPEEARAIAKLKPMIMKYLYKDYMKDDYYLLRFLRAQHLDVDNAKKMLLDSFAWRKLKGIDNIIDEKPSELEKRLHKLYVITSDKDGRPVGFLRVSDWKVRRYLLAGNYNSFIRFVLKLGEISMEKIRDAAKATGKNITTASIVFEISGLNPREHTCFRCMELYLRIISHYEKYYPQMGHRAIAINTPRILLSTFEIIKPVLSEHTRKFLFIYGYDRVEWRNALLKNISNEQLPVYLGGTYEQNEIN